MSEDVEVQYSLTINTELTYSEIRKIEIMLVRVLGYIRRLTGNESLNQAIIWIQRAITTMRTLQMMVHAMEIASGPIGWAYAAVSAIGAAFAVNDMMYDMTRSGS